MTRPLVPRAPKAQGVQPVAPWVALAVLGTAIATSAGAGLYASGGVAGGSAAAVKPLGATGSVALVVPAAREDRAAFPAAAAAPASHSVQIVNFAFAPQVITVTVGDSITWTNQDEAPHTVTTTSGPQSISSPMLSKGQSFTFTFSAPGTYSYYCAVHPDMRAEVVANPAPAPSTSAPSAAPKTSAPVAASSAPSSTHPPAAATTHSAAPSTAHSDHAPASSTTGAPPMSSMPPASPASSAPPAAAASSGTSPAAGAPAAGGPSSSAPAAAAPASATPATDAAALPASAAGSTHPLNPTLILAGLTAGATVYCLLLVASRRPRPQTGAEDDEEP